MNRLCRRVLHARHALAATAARVAPMAQGTADTQRYYQGRHQPLIGMDPAQGHGRGLDGHDRTGIKRRRLALGRPLRPNGRSRRPNASHRRANVRARPDRAGPARPGAAAQFRARALPISPRRNNRPCGPPAQSVQDAGLHTLARPARPAHDARCDRRRRDFSCAHRHAHAVHWNLCMAAASDVRPGEPGTRWPGNASASEGIAHGTPARRPARTHRIL